MKLKNKDKVLYMDKGKQRRKQIADWFIEEIGNSNLMFALKEIRVLINSEDIQEKSKARILFEGIMFQVHDETIKYIFRENITHFGKTMVVRDLMNNIFGKRLQRDTVRYSRQRLTDKETTEVQQDLKKYKEDATEFVYGYNAKGEKVKAVPTPVHIKGVTYVRFKDEKGRFIRKTKKV